MTKDMTQGRPLPLILRFSVPLLLGDILQQLYNLVDTVVVGRYLGITALTAVGATSSLYYLIIGFCTGVCAGFSIPVAARFGAKDFSGMRRLVVNGTYLSAAFAVLITAVTMMLCRDMLALMKTPEKILDDSSAYMLVIFAGIPATFLYNMTAGIIRAMGDSRTPFYFLTAATVLNIILDLLFVIGLGTGISGAAAATVVSQAFSGFLCLLYMRKKYPLLKTEKTERRADGECLRTLAVVGVPLGLQSSITAVGTVMLQSSVNALGLVYVSAYTGVVKIKQFTISPYTAFDTAMATYTSQNFGAGRRDRVSAGVRAGFLIYAVYSVLLALTLILAGDKIALIFVSSSETEVLGYVRMFFRCCGGFYLVIIVLNCLRSVIQGLGHSMETMLAGLCELCARLFMALVMIPSFGYIAVCFTDGSAWVLAGICVLLMYRRIMKKTVAVHG